MHIDVCLTRTNIIAIVKSTPIDLQTFRQETSVKYPTFSPTPAEIPTAKLAEALSPIPVRHHYNHHDDNDEAANAILASNGYNRQGQHHLQQHQQHNATPAPSPPPPSPKANKKQYQTDQTKPFVFPFAPAARVSRRLVPFAIDEADQLYSKHMHVSLALFQMWRTREDFILHESGLKEMPRDDEVDAALKRYSVVAVGNAIAEEEEGDGEGGEVLPDLKRLEEAIVESEAAVRKADASGNRAEKKRANERREDLLRLQRVETIYVGTLTQVSHFGLCILPFKSGCLPILSTWSLVLLKFLLAVITVNNANTNGMDGKCGRFADRESSLMHYCRTSNAINAAFNGRSRRLEAPGDYDESSQRSHHRTSQMVQTIP